MNKRCKIIMIIIVAMLFAAVMISCSSSKSIEFLQEEYIIYLDEGDKLTPSVAVRPSGSDYTLISSNTAVLEVLEDGRTLRAVYPDAIATITAVSGELEAAARVIILSQREIKTPHVPKETFTVFFDTGGRAGIAAQELLPGDKAERPQGYKYQDNIIVGWFTDKDFQNEYDFSLPVTNDITLYALWETGEASFQFITREDGVYIRGLKYASIEYEDIVLPAEDEDGNPVIGIDEHAFYRALTGSKANIVKFTSVVIPATVKVIGKEAFTGISTLKEVFFDGESSLVTIEDGAFQNCGELTTLTLPDSVNYIGTSAFSGAKKLNISALPVGLSVVSANAFNGAGIMSVNLKHVTHIKEQAFYGSRVGTIINFDRLEQLGKNAFLNTPWWIAKRQLNSGADKPVYLGNILVTYYTTSQTRAFDITVEQNTRLVADSAFQNVTQGTIRFTTTTPPNFGSYVFNTESVVVVPSSARAAYAQAIPSFQYKLYTEATILDHLEILVNAHTAANPQTVNVIISKYKANTLPTEYLQRLDVKSPLYDMFPERKANINIQRIKASAFYGIDNLATVVLPPRIYIIETNAFNNLPIFGQLRIEGEYGDYTPSRTEMFNSAINPINSNNYLITVPEDRLNSYKASRGWGGSLYKDKLQGYTP